MKESLAISCNELKWAKARHEDIISQATERRHLRKNATPFGDARHVENVEKCECDVTNDDVFSFSLLLKAVETECVKES